MGQDRLELPRGLADPLHLPEPFALRPWLFAALALLLAALALLLYRRWRRRRRRPAPAPAPAPEPVRSTSELEAAIRRIQSRYRNTGRRRQGCHELSLLLRRHLEIKRPGDVAPHPTMTARELARRLGDLPLTRLLGQIAALQFGRAKPREQDLDRVCELAVAVAVGTGGELVFSEGSPA